MPQATLAIATVGDAVARWARVQPLACAIRNGGVEITYSELDARANAVASFLTRTVPDDGSPIAAILPTGVDNIVWMLGIFRSGHVLVALDPTHPPQRTALILAETAPEVVVAGAAHETAVPAGDFDVVMAEQVDLSAPVSAVPAVDPDDRAWVLYTGGSTGAPKGVVQSHRNAHRNALNQIDHIGYTPADTVLHAYSPSVMGAMRCSLNALVAGSTIVPFDVKVEGLTALRDLLVRGDVTIYQSVATLFRHLVLSLPPDTRFAAVRRVILGGEAATRQDLAMARRHFPAGARMVTGLGSTETGTVRLRTYDFDEEPTHAKLDLGYPVDGMAISVVDENGVPLPDGQTGEILVRSDLIALGYWSPDNDDAGRFGTGADGVRSFRTGDSGVLEPDGSLRHCGRMDRQLKIRGFRVEPAEIEDVMLSHPDVGECVAFGRESDDGDTTVFAVVVAAAEREVDPLDVRAHTAARLPSYMVPTLIDVVAHLPRTAGGKTDRKAVADSHVFPEPMITSDRTADAEFDETRDHELPVLAIARSVLGVATLGATSDLGAAGGSSILAARIAAEIEHRLGIAVALKTVLEATTVRELVEGMGHDQPHSGVVFEADQTSAHAPLFFINSSGQARALSAALPTARPMFALNIFGYTKRFQGEQGPFDIGRLARMFADDIVDSRPEGPLHLVSFCGDSKLTLVIAGVLHELGRPVSSVVLVDGILVRSSLTVGARLRSIHEFGVPYLRHSLRRVVRPVRRGQHGAAPLFGRWRVGATTQPEELTDEDRADRALSRRYIEAKDTLVVDPVRCPVELLLSSEWADQDLSQLRRAAGAGLEVTTFSAYHEAMFDEPYLGRLADLVDQKLGGAGM